MHIFISFQTHMMGVLSENLFGVGKRGRIEVEYEHERHNPNTEVQVGGVDW